MLIPPGRLHGAPSNSSKARGLIHRSGGTCLTEGPTPFYVSRAGAIRQGSGLPILAELAGHEVALSGDDRPKNKELYPPFFGISPVSDGRPFRGSEAKRPFQAGRLVMANRPVSTRDYSGRLEVLVAIRCTGCRRGLTD